MSRVIPTIKSYAYTRIRPLFKAAPKLQTNFLSDIEGNQPIAAICDPMTWRDLCQNHAAISLTPQRWRDAFTKEDEYRIKFLFCEAAWSGTTGACWKGQVYKDERVFYENRYNLLEIIKKCKAEKIQTVFWAKEDPAYFQDATYNFTDTALKFDFIFTTAKECIPKYKVLGHRNVNLLPFGFSPEIYYPPKDSEIPRERASVFAGSWYEDHPKRCTDLTAIFDMVLAAGIPLRIYDRHRVFGRSRKPFPVKYQPYVQDGVSCEALGDIYRSIEYVINVNTVSTSQTMFARRVYESMACGCIVISNDSIGMRQQFGDNVWFAGKNFDHTRIGNIRTENINTVFSKHTWGQRMKRLFAMIGAK